MTESKAGYASLVGNSLPLFAKDSDSSWLDQLSQQLDDTIDLIDAELKGDFGNDPNETREAQESGQLGVTVFPIEEYDWQNVIAT